MPSVVIQILRLFEDPTVSPRSLEKIIEQDPALSAKILRVASSSMYGTRSATSVSRALSVLGINTLRSISISLAYQQILSGQQVGANFDRVAFWRHCLAVGVGSRAIARCINPTAMEELYVAGLMHDIGILTLDRFVPASLDACIKKAIVSGSSLAEAEESVMGYTHAEVGGYLAKRWGLSPAVIAAVEFHHTPDRAGQFQQTTEIITAANWMAYQAGYPAMPGIKGADEGEDFVAMLGLTPEQLEGVATTILAEVRQADKIYGAQPKRAA